MITPFLISYFRLFTNSARALCLIIALMFGSSVYSQSDLKIDPTTVDSTILSLYENGAFQECKTIGIEALKSDSLNQVVIDILAKIFESEQNRAKAIKYNTLRLKLDDSDPKISRKLGQLYADAEIYKEALFFYKKANSLNKKDMLTLKGLIDIYILNEDIIKADSLISKGMEMDSTNVGLLLARARVSYKLKDMERVVLALQKAGNMTNLNNYYLRMLGFANLQIDSLEQAVHCLRLALETDRNPEFTYYYLALAHERLEEPLIAVQYYEKAIESGISKEISNYYQRLGILFVKQDKYKEAYTYLSEALEYERTPVSLYFMAITCDHRYKDKKRAIGYFKEVIKNPGNLDSTMLTYAKSRAQILEEERHQKRVGP